MNVTATRGRRVAALAALAFALVAGCGDDSSVGSDELLNAEGGAGTDNLSLGATTTTTTAATPPPPAATEVAPTETTAPPPAPTTAPPPPPTTAPPQPQQQPALVIEIRSDDTSPQMNPSSVRVFTGQIVRWTNADSVPRSVEADDGSFNSGDLPPGASFDFTFDDARKYNYKDGTRPYVTAQIEVFPR